MKTNWYLTVVHEDGTSETMFFGDYGEASAYFEAAKNDYSVTYAQFAEKFSSQLETYTREN